MASVSMDWPLSREEKKKQVLRLYNEDVQTANNMLYSGEKTLQALCKELDSARLMAGVPCAVDPPTKDSSEVARLRSVVENASAVLRALLPSQDDVDPVGNAGALEAAQRRRKSFGSVREQSTQSALKKSDGYRTPQRGSRLHVSFADDDKKHCESCIDVNVEDNLEVEPEPMLEPEPSPPVEKFQCVSLSERPEPVASVLHWLFDLIVNQPRSLHDNEQISCRDNDREKRTCDQSNGSLVFHDSATHRDASGITAIKASEAESAPRCELRLLLDVRGLTPLEQDCETSSCLQNGDTDVPATDQPQQIREQDSGRNELLEQESGAPQEPDSLLPQKPGNRRARLRARMHGYACCDDNDNA